MFLKFTPVAQYSNILMINPDTIGALESHIDLAGNECYTIIYHNNQGSKVKETLLEILQKIEFPFQKPVTKEEKNAK